MPHVTAASRHTFSARKDDLYETPAVATEALCAAHSLPAGIWEPAAGRGAISDVLYHNGHYVTASDLVDYGSPYIEPGRDFLLERSMPGMCEAIVTNPPYNLATKFVRHALKLCPNVIMLLRLAFLESTGRSDILENAGLARVYVFRNRLPMMHRDGWDGPRATSAVAYAWFVWDRYYQGPTEVHRITWEPSTI